MVIEVGAVAADWNADWEECRVLLRIQVPDGDRRTMKLLGWSMGEAIERERRLHR